MADDKKELSIEEMLAAARAEKGGSDAAPAEEPAAESAEEPAAESADEPAAAAQPAGEMSVEQMLAAARGEKGESESESAEQPDEEPAEEPDAAVKPAGEMSVEEMLAAARGGESDSKPAKSKPADKPAATKKPAAKEAAEPVAVSSGSRDSGSLLGTRKEKPPGPMTNEQARDAGKTAPQLKPGKGAKEAVVVPPMPEKPAYVLPSTTPSQETGSDRRGFFSTVGGVLFGSSLAIGFTSLAVTHLLWLLGLARFMFPNILIERPTRFKVGFPDDFSPGQVTTKFKAQFGIWVVRYEYEGAGQIYALKTVCTHLGCTPNWLEGEQKFKCPCHGSGFYKDGINFEGPAPRPLERYAIRLADDGQLEIDKSRKFNEELGQWADPASFVNV